MGKRDDDDDPFALPPGSRSWDGTAKPPPPADPLPPGSPRFSAPVPPSPPPAPGQPSYGPPPLVDVANVKSAYRGSKNWMGITSLVLGASLIGAGLLGAIFGHLGLAANRRGEADNRGIALAGVIVNYSVILLGLIGFAIAGASSGLSHAYPTHTSGFAQPEPSSTPVDELTIDDTREVETMLESSQDWWGLAVGDCVTSPWIDHPDGSYEVTEPDVVPCGDAHYGEVYAVARVSDGPPPNDATYNYEIESVCQGPLFSDYVGGVDFYLSSLYYDSIYPSDSYWDDGAREFICMLVKDTSGTTTGSLRGSGL